MALRSIGALDTAIRKSMLALEESDNSPEIAVIVSELLLESGEASKAQSILKPFATITNPPYEILFAYAISLDKNGDEADALVAYEQVLDLYPSHIDSILRATRLLPSYRSAESTVEFVVDRAQHFVEPEKITVQCAACLSHFGHQEVATQVLNTISNDSLPEEYQIIVTGILQDDPTDDYSPESIQRMFDSHAHTYDDNFNYLKYRGPELLSELIGKIDFSGSLRVNALDVGCGTGLCGPTIKEVADQLTGIDLSQKMLDVAATKSCYDRLSAMDLMSLDRSYHSAFDLIVCFDTLCYFSDLKDAFSTLRHCLNKNGVLIFTVEQALDDSTDFQLKASGRYGHHKGYLLSTLKSVGFSEPVALLSDTLRLQYDQPVDGYAILVYRNH